MVHTTDNDSSGELPGQGKASQEAQSQTLVYRGPPRDASAGGDSTQDRDIYPSTAVELAAEPSNAGGNISKAIRFRELWFHNREAILLKVRRHYHDQKQEPPKCVLGDGRGCVAFLGSVGSLGQLCYFCKRTRPEIIDFQVRNSLGTEIEKKQSLEMWECVREDLKDKDMGNEKNGRFLCQNALKNYTLVDLGEWTRDQWICDSVWEKGSMCVRCQNAKVAPSAMAWWES